ncbi:MAG: twin-arginine translocation pathway signal [Balneola sp.]|nr:twin-arginine translocation pathway signal [Balneola sp.]MBE80007.1 twin-arginine translocation pathway signal [Balneola sp.]HBX66567.1 twin-arginine translocation pathway signal [Balneolaceae bacterium]
MIWIFGAAALFALIIVILGKTFSQPGYDGPESNHFNGTTFENTGDVPSKGFLDVMKWYLNRDQGEWKEIPEEEVVFAERPADNVTSGMKITYVNHSTFLIQTAGVNILTDPVWSERVSPLDFAGPKRFRPAGVKFEDLPPINLVLISHNHYDHLDIETLKKLNENFSPRFIVPLGVDRYLTEEGLENISPIDWWQSKPIDSDITIHSVEAQHFSARGLFDRDKTLWTGYVIDTPTGSVYFAGDTGYGDFSKKIGQRHQDIKVGLIPIGAYKPRWFMKPMHVNPEEAIQIHKDVNAEISFGMHFGTFPLADDGMKDPENDFSKAMLLPENAGVNFKLLTEGDSFQLSE